MSIKEKREIFGELSHKDLIYLDGRRHSGLPLMGFGDAKGNMKWIGGHDVHSEYLPYSGKLKFKGSKYLKEELEMIDQNKYSISIGENASANVIISSPGATINNKTKIIDKAKTIIKTIENDNLIDAETKQQAIGDITHFIKEVEDGKPNNNTLTKVLTLGSNISSIGSLVISLIQLLSGQ